MIVGVLDCGIEFISSSRIGALLRQADYVCAVVDRPAKSTAIKRELVTTTAGMGGSIAAGALAGLACGPGAPVCVTIGAFIGGALAAFGAGFIW